MQYYTARDEKNWIKTLFYISFTFNNSLNIIIRYVFNEINFNMKIKNSFVFMNILISEE